MFRFPAGYISDFRTQLKDYVPADQDPVDAKEAYPDLRNLEPGLVFPSDSLKGLTVTMRVTLDNGVTVTVPSEELVRPVRGLGQDGKPKINTNYTEIAIYEGGAAEDAMVLGKAFLSTVRSAPPLAGEELLTLERQLYLFVDLESMKFKLAKQNYGAGVPLIKSSAPCPTKPSLDTTDKGLIAGISVLAAIVLLLAAFVFFKFGRGAPGSRAIGVRPNSNGVSGSPVRGDPRVPLDELPRPGGGRNL